MNTFETVVGLEVHLQLNTKTKIFCGCANMFGCPPNMNVCPVCLGLPGALPVFNRQVLVQGIKVGLALNARINSWIQFDRKNYFYPDLPMGYQISQYGFPIASDGFLNIKIDGQTKRIGIKRAHLEEDAGKLLHDPSEGCSWVDFNRTGTPLVEIVSEADLRSSQEAYEYLHALKLTLQYLEVSDCDMEKGSLRCDANISLRRHGEKSLGTKAELKNMNSFRAVKVALDYEYNRQAQVISSGGRVIQETLLWDDVKNRTVPMRSKEHAHDYRYFPDPDLVPFVIDENTVEEIRSGLSELPEAKAQRLSVRYGLSEYDVNVLLAEKAMADFFEKASRENIPAKKTANWVTGPLLKEVKERKVNFQQLRLTPNALADLIDRVETGVVSQLVGKDVLTMMIDEEKTADQVIREKGFAQVSDEAALDGIVDEVLKENSGIVEQIKKGKAGALGFLVGQAMKKSQGRGNPKRFNELFTGRIGND